MPNELADQHATPEDRSYLSDFWSSLAARQFNHSRMLIACALCEECWPVALEHHLEVDRIDPGGAYTLANCQLVCPSCNKVKGANPREHEVRAAIRKAKAQRYAKRNQSRLA